MSEPGGVRARGARGAAIGRRARPAALLGARVGARGRSPGRVEPRSTCPACSSATSCVRGSRPGQRPAALIGDPALCARYRRRARAVRGRRGSRIAGRHRTGRPLGHRPARFGLSSQRQPGSSRNPVSGRLELVRPVAQRDVATHSHRIPQDSIAPRCPHVLPHRCPTTHEHFTPHVPQDIGAGRRWCDPPRPLVGPGAWRQRRPSRRRHRPERPRPEPSLEPVANPGGSRRRPVRSRHGGARSR